MADLVPIAPAQCCKTCISDRIHPLDACVDLNFCSGHGVCNLGSCECLQGWGGSDCSQAVSGGCLLAAGNLCDAVSLFQGSTVTANTLSDAPPPAGTLLIPKTVSRLSAACVLHNSLSLLQGKCQHVCLLALLIKQRLHGRCCAPRGPAHCGLCPLHLTVACPSGSCCAFAAVLHHFSLPHPHLLNSCAPAAHRCLH